MNKLKHFTLGREEINYLEPHGGGALTGCVLMFSLQYWELELKACVKPTRLLNCDLTLPNSDLSFPN